MLGAAQSIRWRCSSRTVVSEVSMLTADGVSCKCACAFKIAHAKYASNTSKWADLRGKCVACVSSAGIMTVLGAVREGAFLALRRRAHEKEEVHVTAAAALTAEAIRGRL